MLDANPSDMRLAYVRQLEQISALKAELKEEKRQRHGYEARNNDLSLQLLEAHNQQREFREQVSWRAGKRCISTYGAPLMCKLVLTHGIDPLPTHCLIACALHKSLNR